MGWNKLNRTNYAKKQAIKENHEDDGVYKKRATIAI